MSTTEPTAQPDPPSTDRAPKIDGPLTRRPRLNLTARAARRSAAHRKVAVLGWLAFVLAAFAVGSATGVAYEGG